MHTWNIVAKQIAANDLNEVATSRGLFTVESKNAEKAPNNINACVVRGEVAASVKNICKSLISYP